MQSMLAAAVENSGDDSVESGKGRQRSQILECLSLSGQLPFLQFLGPLVIEEQCIPHPRHLAPCCLSIDSLP